MNGTEARLTHREVTIFEPSKSLTAFASRLLCNHCSRETLGARDRERLWPDNYPACGTAAVFRSSPRAPPRAFRVGNPAMCDNISEPAGPRAELGLLEIRPQGHLRKTFQLIGPYLCKCAGSTLDTSDRTSEQTCRLIWI